MINIDYFKQKEQAASQKLVYTTSGLLAILNTVCCKAVFNAILCKKIKFLSPES